MTHPAIELEAPGQNRVAGTKPRKNSKSNNSSHLLDLPSVISLFCGAGGLDWGFHREGFKIPLAIDLSRAAIQTYNRNFSDTNGIQDDLIKLGPDGVLTQALKYIPAEKQIGVIGGPPCQGFSRANAGSRADDPRNKLPSLYLDIIRHLQQHYTVEFIVFENVLGIKDKKHAPTYKAFIDGLESLGFAVIEKELCSLDYGVPQLRRRIVVIGMRRTQNYPRVRLYKRKGPSTVREAIGGLAPPAFFARELAESDIPIHPNHWTMNPRSERFINPETAHFDGRSFKRLSWQEPSPTIAFGNREIYVHPNGRRRLSIYEAMLLQSFPHSFILAGNLSEQVELVSNAVPPLLARSIASVVRRSLKGK